MQSSAYTLGFLSKLAEMEKSAAEDVYVNEIKKFMAKRDAKMGVPKAQKYENPTSFGSTVRQAVSRAGDYLGSLGRGAAAAGGVAALRAGQGAFTLATWLPEMADSLVLGKLIGVDEGRGVLGRSIGRFHRAIDRKVHGLRNWSDMYDYSHNIAGNFNKFMHGTAADVVGGFIGYGGPAGLIKKNLLPLAFGALGGAEATWDGRAKQLRDREQWLRTMHPRDRMRVDPTSTAVNQEAAPTLSEYRRYHMPGGYTPTSATGYIDVPYRWRHTSDGAPTQFRDFGT